MEKYYGMGDRVQHNKWVKENKRTRTFIWGECKKAVKKKRPGETWLTLIP